VDCVARVTEGCSQAFNKKARSCDHEHTEFFYNHTDIHCSRVGRTHVAPARSRGDDLGNACCEHGRKEEVDAVAHLIGTAIGWGGNPRSAADYQGFYSPKNDGKTVYQLTVKDVPVDGFWSISVYNDKGYFEKNNLNVYSLNNLTAKPNQDGSFTIQFGGCQKDTPNYLPTMPGWNYMVRLYRPRPEILNGTWKFPEAQPVS